MIIDLQRYPRGHPRSAAAAAAAALLACSFAGSFITLPGRDLDIAWWPGVLLTGVSCTVLMWRRSHPRTTVVLTTACTMGVVALGYVVTVLLLGPLIVALFSLAARTRRRVANTFACASIALLVVTGMLDGPAGEPLLFRLLGPTAWLLLPTALGTASRLYRAYLEEEARRRVSDERIRIARDLHDVVAHHLVLTKLQAGAVVRLVHARPAEAEQVATELTDTAAAALSELKATVGLLRRADDTEQPIEPTPGVAQLTELTASFQSAGLAVTVATEGEPRPLPAGADLSAYRIVQEALTNVTKHATTRSAEVRLAYSEDHLCITVTNDGSATSVNSPFPRGGYGIIGMRERARSVGGELRAGPRDQGGFEVVTQLPLRPRSFQETATS
ncbi:sensor histidine kinase [Streptomyces sp. NPDC090798]|uniref:sensor histidine kinase n=1 Tax=Streptomyces sp. NPDC090798 TaxID=3365968 RepID=UPI00380EA87D